MKIWFQNRRMKEKKTGLVGVTDKASMTHLTKITSVSTQNHRASPVFLLPPVAAGNSSSGSTFSSMEMAPQLGITCDSNNNTHLGESSTSNQNSYHATIETPVNLQLQYNISSHSSVNLKENSAFCYNSDQQFAAKGMSLNQRNHKPYNHQHCQARESQSKTSSYASQFPSILSVLREEYSTATAVCANLGSTRDPSYAGETASANIYWSKKQTQPYFEQPQYQPVSLGSACDKTNELLLDAHCNDVQRPFCVSDSQNEQEMPELVAHSARLVKDQSDSQVLESEILELFFQAASKTGHNDSPLPAEQQIDPETTNEISLYSIENSIEESVPTSLQDNTNVRPCTNATWNPPSSEVSGMMEGENISTSYFSQSLFQL